MQLLEYDAKRLLREAGLPVPEGIVVSAPDQIPSVVFPVVVKSQVPVGGRGKLGGVKTAHDQTELEELVANILQLDIKGYKPNAVLIEPALEIARELYLALRINRDQRRLEYIVAAEGGVEIESHASDVDVLPDSPDVYEQVAKILQLDAVETKKLTQQLEIAFVDNDCLLIEINPLAVTTRDQLFCADAKIQVDDNARFRQENLPLPEVTDIKPLGGNIGVVANGAGMAMSTMDTIYAAGGKPANFLDIGGGTGQEVFATNLQKIADLPGITSIIINIFAGITRCDDIARGILASQSRVPNLPPLYVRLEGTNREEAAALLADAGIDLQPDLASCVKEAMNYV